MFTKWKSNLLDISWKKKQTDNQWKNTFCWLSNVCTPLKYRKGMEPCWHKTLFGPRFNVFWTFWTTDEEERRRSFMPSHFWEWVLHGRALNTVFQESQCIQRLWHSTFARRWTSVYSVELELHGKAFSRLRRCRTCNETFTHQQSLSSHTFSLKCRVLGKDSVCTIF